MRLLWAGCLALLVQTCSAALETSVAFLPESELEEHFQEDGLEDHSGRVKRSFDMSFDDMNSGDMSYSSSASYWIGGVSYQPDGTLNYLGETKTFPSSGRLDINGVTFLRDQKVIVDGKTYTYKNMGGDSSQYMASYWIGGVNYLPDGTLNYLGEIKTFPSSGRLELNGVTFLRDQKVIVDGKTYIYKNMGGDSSQYMASYWIGGVSYMPDGSLNYLGDIKTFPSSGRLELNGVTFLRDQKVIVDGKTYKYENTKGGSSENLGSYWIGGVNYLPDGTLDYLGQVKTFPSSGRLEINGVTFLKDQKVIVKGQKYNYKSTGGDTSQYLGSYWIGGVKYMPDGTLNYLGDIKTFPSSGKLEINGVTFLKDQKVIVDGQTYNYKSKDGDNGDDYLPSYWMGGVRYRPDGSLDVQGEIKRFPSSGRLTVGGVTFLRNRKVIVNGQTYKYRNEPNDRSSSRTTYFVRGVSYMPDGTLSYMGTIKRFPSNGRLNLGGITFLKDRKVIVKGKTYPYNNNGGSAPYTRPITTSTYRISNVFYRPDGTLSYQGKIYKFPSDGRLTIAGRTFLRNGYIIVNGKRYLFKTPVGKRPYKPSAISPDPVFLPDGNISYGGRIYRFPSSGRLTVANRVFFRNRTVLSNNRAVRYQPRKGNQIYRLIRQKYPIFLRNGNMRYLGRVYSFQGDKPLRLDGKTFYRNRTILKNGRLVRYRPYRMYGKKLRPYSNRRRTPEPVYLSNGNIVFLGRTYTFDTSDSVNIFGRTFFRNRTVLSNGRAVRYRPRNNKPKRYRRPKISTPVFLKDGRISYRGKIYPFQPNGQVIIKGQTFMRGGMILVQGRPVKYDPKNIRKYPGFAASFQPRAYRRPGQEVPVFMPNGDVKFRGKIQRFKTNGKIVINGVTFVRGGFIMVQGRSVKYEPKKIKEYPGFEKNFPVRKVTAYVKPEEAAPVFLPNGNVMFEGKVRPYQPNGKVVINGQTFVRGGMILVRGKRVKYNPKDVKKYPSFVQSFPASISQPGIAAPVFLKDGTILFQGKIYKFTPKGRVNIKGITFTKDKKVVIGGKTVPYKPGNVQDNPGFKKQFPESISEPELDVSKEPELDLSKDPTSDSETPEGETQPTDESSEPGTPGDDTEPESDEESPDEDEVPEDPDGDSVPSNTDEPKRPISGNPTYLKNGSVAFDDKVVTFKSDKPITVGKYTFYPNGTVEHNPKVNKLDKLTQPSKDTYGIMPDGNLNYYGEIKRFPSSGEITIGDETFYRNGTVVRKPHSHKKQPNGKVMEEVPGPTKAPIDYPDYPDYPTDPSNLQKMKGDPTYLNNGSLVIDNKVMNFEPNKPIKIDVNEFYPNGTVVHTKHSHKLPKDDDSKPKPNTYSILSDGTFNYYGVIYKFPENGKIEIGENVFLRNGSVVIKTHTHQAGPDGKVLQGKPGPKPTTSPDGVGPNGPDSQRPFDPRNPNSGDPNSNFPRPNYPTSYNPNNPESYQPGPNNPAGYNPNNPASYQPGPNNPAGYNPNNPASYQPGPNYPSGYNPTNPASYQPVQNYPSGYNPNNPASYQPGPNYPSGYNPTNPANYQPVQNYPSGYNPNNPASYQPGPNYPDGYNPNNPASHKPGPNYPDGYNPNNSGRNQPGPNYPDGYNPNNPRSNQPSRIYRGPSDSNYPRGYQLGQTSPEGINPYNPQQYQPGQFPEGFLRGSGPAGQTRPFFPQGPNFMGFPIGSSLNPQGFRPGQPEYEMYMKYWTQHMQPSRNFRIIEISRVTKPRDKTIRAKPRRNKPKTSILPHGLIMIDEPHNEEIIGVYTVLKERIQGHRLPSDVKTDLVRRTKPILSNVFTSITTRLSDGICFCKDTQCYCCANMGSIGSGCLLIEVYNPDSQPGVDLRIMTGETELASLTMSRGGSRDPVCFDIIPYLVEGCIKQTYFTMQGTSLFACFSFEVPVFGMSGKYCITHTVGGDPCITGSPLK